MIRIGIVTISDRASHGEYEDESGPAIVEFLRESLNCEWEPLCATDTGRAGPDRSHSESVIGR